MTEGLAALSREPRRAFRGRPLPEPAHLAGYAALIDAFDLKVPLPYRTHAIATRHVRVKDMHWQLHTPAAAPRPDSVSHLVFALKREGVDLLVLKHAFLAMGPAPLEAAILGRPTSAYLRRLWFFLEWLTGRELGLDGTEGGNYADAIDPRLQYAAAGENVPRMRVRDNLPGTAAFCPLVHRTRALDAAPARVFADAARALMREAPDEVIRRAAAFLLLKDSKASFAIEGERPRADRAARWGAAIGRAGREALTADLLLDLQRIVIGDDRFVRLGWRQEGGFVGEHNPLGEPVPDHISARAEDLSGLIEGLIAYDTVSDVRNYDPILAAAALAFGFVYIHPFEDGNGRIHRFLFHHVLAERQVSPPDVIFPVSTAIYDDLLRYRTVLETVSRPLLPLIDWRATERGNIEVLSDTADYYRYFDATPHAEYLADLMRRTLETTLPEELRFLEERDRFHERVTRIVDMPERTLDLLLSFLRQNGGRLSRRAQKGEFAALTEPEADAIEGVYATLRDPPAG